MKTLKERVVEQIQAERSGCSLVEARMVVQQMTGLELLEYVSGEVDEMFKEQWDQARDAIISSAR